MRRTPIRRKRAPRRSGLLLFWEEVTGHGRLPCALDRLGGCDGHLDAHHLIEQQHLRDREARDPRNGIPVCRHHHGELHARRIYLTSSDLSLSFLEFAEEIGQAWRIDYLLGPR